MSSPQVLIVSDFASVSLIYRLIEEYQVGGGPSGLVLALSLLKNGISVRVIDKNPELRIGQRGAGIMVCGYI